MNFLKKKQLNVAGPVLVKKFRPDLQKKFGESEEDDTIFDYIYHCNAQTPRYTKKLYQY